MARVRFAPSPTGYLHIGGVRTALFNYLYAKSQGGQFLLRIEDTDRQRSRPEFEKEILASLEWLGLQWDDERVYQSHRLERHRELAGELIEKGLAYEEERDGKKAVVFRMPKKEVVFHDVVHGRTQFDASLFDDLVIVKSDGSPTYHFACVADDHDMEISHVIRGDDHLSNTPRQILLYEAFGWKPPKFAHLPMIAGPDGSLLSKRHGAIAVSEYRKLGYIPEGLLNFLALLGWGSDANQEIFTLEQLIRKFSLKKVNKSKAAFNPEKLLWLNGQHIKKLPENDYVERISRFYRQMASQMGDEEWRKLALLYRPRIKIFSDLMERETYLFQDIPAYPAETAEALWKDSRTLEMLKLWGERMESQETFEDDKVIENLTRQLAAGQGVEARAFIHPLRFIMTGKTVSPGIFELMSVLGKPKCLLRLKAFLDKQIPAVREEKPPSF